MPTYMSMLLKEKFERQPRIKVPKGFGVVWMSDNAMFMGTQLLYYSLILSHEVNMVIFDMGMTDSQRDWCSRHGIPVVVVSEEQRNKLSVYWNKPYCLLHSPFEQTLYLDADTVVTGDLNIVCEHLRTQPFFVTEHFAKPEVAFNDPELYERFPVPKRSPCPVNSGVIGIDRKRDFDIVTMWYKMCERAQYDPFLEKAFSWYDQGALLWVLETTGYFHLIRNEEHFNSPVLLLEDLHKARRDTPEEVISMVRRGKLIKHFQGTPKPWTHWDHSQPHLELEPDNYIECLSNDLKIFVIGHDEERLRMVPKRPYLEAVNLHELTIGEHQTNKSAESRIFLSNLPETATQDYIGFATPRWDDKYVGMGILPLGELHRMRFHLKPNNVICAMRTDNVYGPLGDFDRVNWKRHIEYWNPGVMQYLDEIDIFTGVKGEGVSFWSNNFICHKRVFREFVAHWRKVYDHFYRKYKNNFSFTGVDPRRTPSYVYEGITIHYFSTRTDLNIIEAWPAVAARD